ncbi:hypothetical protein QT972_27165, partial [Microcoleus sp. herbarium7]|uniref:phage head spike fiber domain-containing protein n=1 Tax=Microcoleus sp. herbarium7 TaxID=3055435 RepID=UPI002FD666E7
MGLSLAEIRKSIILVIEGRLSTLQNEIPNFSRPSPVLLESLINSSVSLSSIQSNVPAIDPQNGSILLQPSRTNLLNYNLDIKQSVWQKGSNVLIRGDTTIAPDGSQRGDRLSWNVGTGNTQLIQRTLTLKAGTSYYLSGLMRLMGGRFANLDVVRMVGGVIGNPAITLTSLNSYLSNNRWIELPFTTLGQQPKLPNTQILNGYAISSVSASSVTLSSVTGIASKDLVGGQIGFSSNPNKRYNILDNAVSGSNVVITTDPTLGSLVADGVTTSRTALLYGAPDVISTLQFYVESAISLDWGGLQLEESGFRTSMIYQDASISSRSQTKLVYRKASNPLSELKTFGLLIDLRFWRGDGNILTAGNISVEIVDSKLRLTVGTTVINVPTVLPPVPQIYIQQSGENFTLTLCINKTLVARSNLAGFQAGRSPIVLTTEGVRCFNRIVAVNRAFGDGAVAIGEVVTGELADVLFSEITDVSAIAVSVPEIVLPVVTIPSPEAPAASSEIQAINSAGRIVTVADGNEFGTSGSVLIFRPAPDGDRSIASLTITGKTGNQISLDSVAGIALGDKMVSDFVARPGKASVRLPFLPIDPQTISAVNTTTRQVTVGATLAFVEKRRAIVQSPLYQDVSEVIVETVDNANTRLTLNSVTNISVGDIISQPDEEIEIPVECYFVDLLTPNPAIE